MIFVTVGTHEQPFNRLVKYIDELKGQGIITEDVIIQTGYSSYTPRYSQFQKLISYDDMVKYISNARIVVTHGGPASFIMPLYMNKIPIVVPRQQCFHEHVNNHQLDFVNFVSLHLNNIIPVYEIEKLKEIILDYDRIIVKKVGNMSSNNYKFNLMFEQLANNLFKK